MGYAEAEALLNRCQIDPGSNALRRAACGSVLACAVLAHRAGRWSSYSRRAGFYTGLTVYHPAMTESHVVGAVDYLAADGWIEHQKAGAWSTGKKGQQSRFVASERLQDAVGALPISTPRLHEVIRWYDPEGHLKPFNARADHICRLRREILELNETTKAARIDLTDERVLRLDSGHFQIPTKAGDDTFLVRGDALDSFRQFDGTLKRHGRLYGAFWQNLPKDVRRTLTIGGESTVSIDIANAHLRIAYGIVKADVGPVSQDLYAMAGWEAPNKRALLKKAVNIAFNAAGGRQHAVTTLAWDIAQTEAEPGHSPKIGAFDLAQAESAVATAERRHAPVAGLFYTGAGLDLMYPESNVQLAVAKAARKRGIPVLGIHDEFIVPASKGDEVEGLVHDAWRAITGTSCRTGRC